MHDYIDYDYDYDYEYEMMFDAIRQDCETLAPSAECRGCQNEFCYGCAECLECSEYID